MLIASFVGGLIIFIWQFLSFAAINFHEPAQAYTEKQDAILAFLESQQLEEGGYFMPSLPKTASREEWEAAMQEQEGKPWASIQYHHSMSNNMVGNMIRGYITNVIVVFLFCWLIEKFSKISTGRTFLAALAVGMIVFLNGPYIGHIWYQFFDTWAHLMDAIVSWGLVGLWIGWYLGRNRKDEYVQKIKTPSYNMTS